MCEDRLQAISTAIDDVSLQFLQDGAAGATNAAECRAVLSAWFGKVLGRRSNAIIILQQQYVVVSECVCWGW